jgi:hypothetical protein
MCEDEVITAPDFEIDTFARLVTGRLCTDPRYVALHAISRSGRFWPGCSSQRSVIPAGSPGRIAGVVGWADSETPRVRLHRDPAPCPPEPPTPF